MNVVLGTRHLFNVQIFKGKGIQTLSMESQNMPKFHDEYDFVTIRFCNEHISLSPTPRVSVLYGRAGQTTMGLLFTLATGNLFSRRINRFWM